MSPPSLPAFPWEAEHMASIPQSDSRTLVQLSRDIYCRQQIVRLQQLIAVLHQEEINYMQREIDRLLAEEAKRNAPPASPLPPPPPPPAPGPRRRRRDSGIGPMN